MQLADDVYVDAMLADVAFYSAEMRPYFATDIGIKVCMTFAPEHRQVILFVEMYWKELNPFVDGESTWSAQMGNVCGCTRRKWDDKLPDGIVTASKYAKTTEWAPSRHISKDKCLDYLRWLAVAHSGRRSRSPDYGSITVSKRQLSPQAAFRCGLFPTANGWSKSEQPYQTSESDDEAEEVIRVRLLEELMRLDLSMQMILLRDILKNPVVVMGIKKHWQILW